MKALKISRDHQKLMRLAPFRHKQIGIEFTTIPKECYDGEREYPSEEVELEYQDAISHHPLVLTLHVDPGCIEVPSEVMGNWKDTLRFFTHVFRASHALGGRQLSPYQTGGGGHIHISYRSWNFNADGHYNNAGQWTARACANTNLFTNAMQKYLTQHPWIAWAFNDPCDNITARLGNGVACRDSNDNLEFRFFNAARDINQQIEHVAFALKLVEKTRILAGIDYHERINFRVKRMPCAKALAGWKHTIEEFKLPWKLYRKYARNIRERYQLGKEYLN